MNPSVPSSTTVSPERTKPTFFSEFDHDMVSANRFVVPYPRKAKNASNPGYHTKTANPEKIPELKRESLFSERPKYSPAKTKVTK